MLRIVYMCGLTSRETNGYVTKGHMCPFFGVIAHHLCVWAHISWNKWICQKSTQTKRHMCPTVPSLSSASSCSKLDTRQRCYSTSHTHDSFHWKCHTTEIHQIEKFKFLGTNSSFTEIWKVGWSQTCTTYWIWSVIAWVSNVNRGSSSLALFCHVPLKKDQWHWDWT